MKQYLEQSEKDYIIKNCKAITKELEGQQYDYGYLFEKAYKIVEALKDNQRREQAIDKEHQEDIKTLNIIKAEKILQRRRP